MRHDWDDPCQPVGVLDYLAQYAPKGTFWSPHKRWMSPFLTTNVDWSIHRTEGAIVVFASDDPLNVEWLTPTINALNTLLAIEDADEEALSPADPKNVSRALGFLSEALPRNAAPPSFSPLNDGGVQAEWHRGGLDVEVIFSDDPDESGIYVHDKATGEERELPLTRAVFVAVVGNRLNVAA